jgi:NAD(P)-dependent dehydrogenase (short-subunit alcohol dehydrogenase family)
MKLEFSNRKILVTGASSGIGRACALALLAAGAEVAAVGRNEPTLADLGLPASRLFLADLTDEAQVKALTLRIKAVSGPLDGCIFAAGIHTFRPFFMESFADIQRPWALNFQGNLGLLAQLLKSRLLAKGSSLVLFSSAAARKAGSGAVSYAASKGAIESATRALALELAPQRIRINAISAGVVRTPMSESFLSKLTTEQVAALEARHPMGFGSPEDIAGPAMFLLSSQASWITGAILSVDGGYSLS